MLVDRARSWTFADASRRYDWRDVMLYALGLGVGGDPLDPEQLSFVTEDHLRALPTLGVVLGRSVLVDFFKAAEIDAIRVVHAGQRAIFDGPLPIAGETACRGGVCGVWDKGAKVGALIALRQEIFDVPSGRRYCELTSLMLARGDGGWGGDPGSPPSPHTTPNDPPDRIIDHATLPQAALIYRLSGDRNSLHSDPAAAHRAGFERPILHGHYCYGVAGWIVTREYFKGQPERLAALDCRFCKPVFPGETLRMEMWRRDDIVSFQMRALERDVVVLDQGRAAFR